MHSCHLGVIFQLSVTLWEALVSRGVGPSVFVSSTCYDLAEVRSALCQFLASMGLDPILSEHNSFPIDPGLNAVDNCLRVVEDHADIFVLLVGDRYGSVTREGKSVTNLEYLRAKAKGIPLYVFIQQPLREAFEDWQRSHDRQLPDQTERARLFTFIGSLMNTEARWIFSFRDTEEIQRTLRIQISQLFVDALQHRAQITSAGLPQNLSSLRGEALRLVIERPLAWEYRLFSQVLCDELEKGRPLSRDVEYRIVLDQIRRLNGIDEILRWLSESFPRLQKIATALDTLINRTLPDACGPPGHPGDPEKLVYTAQRVAETYCAAIQWKMECACIEVTDEFKSLVDSAAHITSNMIEEIEAYASDLRTTLADAVKQHEPGRQQVLNITWRITGDFSRLNSELEKHRKRYERRSVFRRLFP